jgi:hypothetical protein
LPPVVASSADTPLPVRFSSADGEPGSGLPPLTILEGLSDSDSGVGSAVGAMRGPGNARDGAIGNEVGAATPLTGAGASRREPRPERERGPTAGSDLSARLAATTRFPPSAEREVAHPAPAVPLPADSGPAAASDLHAGRSHAHPAPAVPGEIARMAASLHREAGATEVRLRLDPPSLGEVRVRITSTSQGVQIRIVTHCSEACSALADGQPQLKTELERHGLTLQSFSTSVDTSAAGSGDGATRRENGHPERSDESREARDADRVRGRAVVPRSSLERAELSVEVGRSHRRPARSGLDARA